MGVVRMLLAFVILILVAVLALLPEGLTQAILVFVWALMIIGVIASALSPLF